MRLLIDDVSDNLVAYPVADIESIVITSAMKVDKTESDEITNKIEELTEIDKSYPIYTGPNYCEIGYLQRKLRELEKKLLYSITIKLILKQITPANQFGYGAEQTSLHFIIGEFYDKDSAINKFNDICEALADESIKIIYISQIKETIW